MVMYGIPNCNTVKKARVWLASHNIHCDFHDYRKDGITKEKIQTWLTQVTIDQLINKSGMTYRNLSAEEKDALVIVENAIATMIAKPSIIRRPLLEDEHGKIISIGFSEEKYSLFLK